MADNTSSVRQRIRDLIDTTNVSDPHDLAAKLIESATPAEKKQWLAETLPAVVADVMRLERNAALSDSASSRRTPSRSAKVAGVRDWWSRFCASHISVAGEWRPVGDLDAESLATVIKERRELAAQVTVQADRYEQLLALLGEFGVATVSELPRDAVAQFEGVAVA